MKTIARRRSVRVSLLAILMAVLGFLLISAYNGNLDKLRGSPSIGYDTQADSGLVLRVDIGGFSPPAFPREIDVAIRQIEADVTLLRELSLKNQTACVDRIEVSYVADGGRFGNTRSLVPGTEVSPICFGSTLPGVISLDAHLSVDAASLTGATFPRFPFDSLTLHVDFKVVVYRIDQTTGGRIPGSMALQPTSVVNVSASAWEVEEADAADASGATFNALRGDAIRFSRPLLTKMAVLLVFALLIMSIVGVIVINDAAGSIELTVGVIFGMFTARQIVVPDGAPTMTSFDVGLLCCELILVLALLGSIFVASRH